MKDSEQRKTQILKAVNRAIREEAAWAADVEGTDIPNAAMDASLVELGVVVRDGDLPKTTIAVALAALRVADLWQAYRDGDRVGNQYPTDEFWAAFREMQHYYRGVDAVDVAEIEPVHVILEQAKHDPRRHEYVARAYGWREETEPNRWVWTGPFFKNGVVDTHAVEQHAAFERGEHTDRVLPPDWILPSEQDRINKRNVELLSQLDAMRDSRHENSEDPATILELLQQGQYPDVIARVKNTTLDEVHHVARTNDLVPNDRSNPEPWGAPADVANAVAAESVDVDRDVVADEAKESIRDAVYRVADTDAGLGSGEIVALLAEEGVVTTARQVAAFLRSRERVA